MLKSKAKKLGLRDQATNAADFKQALTTARTAALQRLALANNNPNAPDAFKNAVSGVTQSISYG